MGVDLLRSCYETDMQFYEPPGQPVKVKWWFCRPDAKVLPYYTRFASGNWASSRDDWTGLGEIQGATRFWSDGEPPGPYELAVNQQVGLTISGPVDNTITSTEKFTVRNTGVILVFVWYFVDAGPGLVTSVTDTVGNVYVRDFQRLADADDRIGIAVFRAASELADVENFVTVNFAGSKLRITFHAVSMFGMLNEAPHIVKHATGIGGTAPSIPTYPSAFGDTFSIASFSCRNVVTYVNPPENYITLQRWFSMPSREDGGTAIRFLFGRTTKVKGLWDVTTNGPWVACALNYRSIPRYRLPGKSACGTAEQWAAGGVPGDNLGADLYGVSACCSKALYQLSCNLLPSTDLTMRIIAIHNHGPDSISFVGMLITFRPVDVRWQTVTHWMKPTWMFQQPSLFLNCDFARFFCDSQIGSSRQYATSARRSPPAVYWDMLFPSLFTDAANMGEWWEAILEVVPPAS